MCSPRPPNIISPADPGSGTADVTAWNDALVLLVVKDRVPPLVGILVNIPVPFAIGSDSGPRLVFIL